MASPEEGVQPPFDPDRPPNLVLIVGQLLEATKAAGEGLKSVSAEARQNSLAILKAAQTLEITERIVVDLNRIVRTGSEGSPALAVELAEHTRLIADIRKRLAEIDTLLNEGEKRMNDLDRADQRSAGIAEAVKIGAIVVFNLVTLLVALYAALK